MRRALLLLCLGTWFSAPACSHYKTPGEQLFVSAKAFNEHVRWKRLRLASNFVPPTQRQRWLDGMQQSAETMRVVDYRMVPVRIGSDTAVIDVMLASYLAHDPTVQRQRRRQWWRLDDGAWRLERDKRLPLRKNSKPKPMPEIRGEHEPPESISNGF
jgi:hypothetical protein